MNNEQIRAVIVRAAVGLVVILLLWSLGSALEWPVLVVLLLLLVVLVVAALAIARALRTSGPARDPFPAAPVRSAAPPPASVAMGPVPIPSSDPAYRFRFSATVHWPHQPTDTPEGRNRRAAHVQEALLDRAITAARLIDPGDHAAAGYRIAAALAQPIVAPKAEVQVWASEVRVELAEEDAERLAKLDRIRKDVQLWEQERAHEKEVRRYLGEDVLSSPGSALVWWLARHEDDIRGSVERIPDLTQISAVARGVPYEPVGGFRPMGQPYFHPDESGPNGDGAPRAAAGPSAPRSPADSARDLIDGLFPDETDRGLFAGQLGELLRRWGKDDVASSLRDPSNDPLTDSHHRPGMTTVETLASADQPDGVVPDQADDEPDDQAEPARS